MAKVSVLVAVYNASAYLPVCLDSLLNQPRVYTVWAPINSAVDKDALIEQIENGERETVFQQFVKYHISNFRHPANGTLENNSLLMLNGKYVAFVGDAENGYTYGGREVVETNIHAKNGIIHKISTAVEYKPSVWEMLVPVSAGRWAGDCRCAASCRAPCRRRMRQEAPARHRPG